MTARSSPESLQSPLLCTERSTAGAQRIGVATLNAPATLNAISLDMVDLLDACLRNWQEDNGICAVVLQGSGDKAFCAGGDVVELYHSICANPGGPNAYAERFFEREYRLDHLLHRYGKPVLCWGNGIVMGGGLGLMVGCSHRVVTERSRLAMPEAGIGFYPDVGATWFLRKMPAEAALFVALTGASLNAQDALDVDLADFAVQHDQREAVIQKMAEADWSHHEGGPHQTLTQILEGFESSHRPVMAPGHLGTHRKAIAHCASASLVQAAQALRQLAHSEDPWLATAGSGFAACSPLSAALIWAQLHAPPPVDCATAFQRELVMSVRCSYGSDFAEGVRARLVDRDQRPQWRHKCIEDVPAEATAAYFLPFWDGPTHPLADLH